MRRRIFTPRREITVLFCLRLDAGGADHHPHTGRWDHTPEIITPPRGCIAHNRRRRGVTGVFAGVRFLISNRVVNDRAQVMPRPIYCSGAFGFSLTGRVYGQMAPASPGGRPLDLSWRQRVLQRQIQHMAIDVRHPLIA